MSDPGTISAAVKPVSQDFASEAAGQTDGDNGEFAGKKVSIVASGSENIAEPAFVGNEQLINQLAAGQLREAAPAHNLDSRIRGALNELTAYKGMGGKLRSLVSAIRKFFAFKAPDTRLAAPQSSFVASPYANAMKQALANGGDIKTYMAISNFDELHSALEQKEQIGKWLKSASVSRVGSELVRSQLPFGRIISEASTTTILAKDKATQIFDNAPGLDASKKQELRDKLLETVELMYNVMETKYTPDHRRLRGESTQNTLKPRLASFANPEKNPYKDISSGSNFSKQQDENLRAWLASGLEAINAASQAIEQLIINHDVTADTSPALKFIESKSKR